MSSPVDYRDFRLVDDRSPSPSSSSTSSSFSTGVRRVAKPRNDIAAWMTVYAFRVFTDRDLPLDNVMFMFSSAHATLQAVFLQLIDSRQTTPSILLHTLVYMWRFCNKSSLFNDLIESKKSLKQVCLVIRMCYILAAENCKSAYACDVTHNMYLSGLKDYEEYVTVRENIRHHVSANGTIYIDAARQASWSKLFRTSASETGSNPTASRALQSLFTFSSSKSWDRNTRLSDIPTQMFTAPVRPRPAPASWEAPKPKPKVPAPAAWNPAADPEIPRASRERYIAPGQSTLHVHKPKPCRIIDLANLEEQACYWKA
ncbi:hypothetical protein CYLTODRAFT_488090 [Cylindrobasidium torrendii FP15055 ss-10]|uniref:Uncharacterized protein n=1 Tax=Cylindrobasidium torrendii FP15055 ss-10 TaxID=1314674 RepID=A0A0D7BJJ7_9AGAR|nr:hypothetical protein CYLTODRAFT_488090 [Cylindrobasidium torrendii FP15055 ss-10]